MREYDVNEPVEERGGNEMRMDGAPRGYDRGPELGELKMVEIIKEFGGVGAPSMGEITTLVYELVYGLDESEE